MSALAGRKETSTIRSRRRFGAHVVAVAVMLASLSPVVASGTSHQDVATLIRTVDLSALDPPSPDPSAITYIPATDRFIVSDSEVEETMWYRNANLFEIARTGELMHTGTTTLPNPAAFSKEPAGSAFDPATGTLLLSDDNTDQLSLVRPGTDGIFGTGDDAVEEAHIRVLVGDAAIDPEGIALDPKSGEVFIVDGAGSEVYRWNPGSDRLFETDDDVQWQFDLERYGAFDPEGIAYDIKTGTLLVIDKRSIVYELDARGSLIRTLDARASGARHPSGLEIAPSSVNPRANSLWIVDRGIDSDFDPLENDGRLFEMSLARGAPVVEILEPVGSVLFTEPTRFRATAADPDDGDVSASLQWWSDRDGSIGSGAEFVATLSPGMHTVTATALDAGGILGSASMSVTLRHRRDGAVASGSDDTEEHRLTGGSDTTGTDLELGFDGLSPQRVGLRFHITVPRGARVVAAWVQFKAAGTSQGRARLRIEGEASDDAAPFTDAVVGASARQQTDASVAWDPPEWPEAGAAGPGQRTPDLSPIVSEIVGRPGWSAGNAVAFLLTGFGSRVASSFEGGDAPVLHLEWE